jgi:hypothetical protein
VTRTPWNVLDPGDAEIRAAWEEWRTALALSDVASAGAQHKQKLKADQWREMYLALLSRRDARPGSE